MILYNSVTKRANIVPITIHNLRMDEGPVTGRTGERWQDCYVRRRHRDQVEAAMDYMDIAAAEQPRYAKLLKEEKTEYQAE